MWSAREPADPLGRAPTRGAADCNAHGQREHLARQSAAVTANGSKKTLPPPMFGGRSRIIPLLRLRPHYSQDLRIFNSVCYPASQGGQLGNPQRACVNYGRRAACPLPAPQLQCDDHE